MNLKAVARVLGTDDIEAEGDKVRIIGTEEWLTPREIAGYIAAEAAVNAEDANRKNDARSYRRSLEQVTGLSIHQIRMALQDGED